MSDLTTLASSLKAQATSNSTIVLDDSVFSSAVLDQIREAFDLDANANLTINGVSDTDIPAPANNTLILSAGSIDTLNVSGLGIEITFTAPSSSIEAVIAITMPSSWKFTDSYPGLELFPFQELAVSDAQFIYTTTEQNDYPWPGDPSETIYMPVGLNFLSDVTLNNFSLVSSILGAVIGTTPFKFYGPFASATGSSLPVGKIKAPISSSAFGIGVAPNDLTLSDPAVAVCIQAATSDNPAQEIDLLIEANLNNTLNFAISIPMSGEALTLNTTPLPNQSSINSIIESLPGGSDFTDYIPSELSSIFANVGLDNFSMSISGAPKVTFISLSISTLNPWTIVDNVIVLEGLNLRVQSLDPTGQNWTQVFITAEAAFLPTIFTGKFDFEVKIEKQASWEVSSVRGVYFGGVNLGDIVNGLLGSSSSAPAILHDITFSNFGVEATRSGQGQPFDYSFYGGIEAAFPMLGKELTAQLDIAVSKTPTSYDIQLSGLLVVGSQTFSLNLDLGTAGSKLTATWTDTGTPLEFADIANAFGFDDLPDIPSSLDLALTNASFTYDFTNKVLILTAKSQNYGSAVFVSDGLQSGATFYGFGINIPLDITLADIPLVGDKIPDADNLGIPEAGIWILSTDLKEADAKQINDYITGDSYPKLPDQDISDRVLLHADLKLGSTNTMPLELALGGSSEKQDQGQDQQEDPQQQDGQQPGQQIGAAPTPAASSGGDNTKWFNIQRQFSIFQFNRIGISYHDNALFFSLDAGIDLGPLIFSFDGLSIGSPLTHFSPTFDIQGLGLSYNKPPLEIAGALLKIPSDQLAPNTSFQFDGLAVVKASEFSLSAIGSYAQLKSGDPSLFVFAQLETPLGGPPAFFVTGLMAGFGFNRSIEIPAQDEVMGFPLLVLGQPPAPGQPADTQQPSHVLDILEGRAPITSGGQTKEWIKPSPGDYWLAVGLEFTSFELVESKAMLIVEFGHDLVFSLLGLSTLQLPQASESSHTYAYVELQIKAVFKPEDGFFGLSAVLSNNSYVLTPDCKLTGGFAFYIWFGDNEHSGQFVVTLGGYHPAFKPPSYFPSEPRLGFNWAVSSNVSIKGGAYFALTPSCAMAGGSLEAMYHSGDLKAWFTAHMDVLVSWRPFFYTASIGVSLGASYRLNLLFCHKTISVSIGASVDIWGPPTGGKVRVHIVVVTVTIKFGSKSASANNTPLGWSDFKDLLPHPNDVCSINATDGMFKTQESSTSSSGKTWIVRAQKFKFFTQAPIPAGGLRYGDPASDAVLDADMDLGAASGQTDYGNGSISIRPMNKKGVASTHRLKIFKDSSSTPEDVSQWSLTPRYGNMPETLWAEPPADFTQIPSTPSSATIDNQLVGYNVAAPAPEIGSSLGVVPLKALSEEYLSPPGKAPIDAGVTESPDFVPTADATSIADIQQIAQTQASTNRDALYAALQSSQIFNGSNGSVDQIAAQAESLYADAPMLQN